MILNLGFLILVYSIKNIYNIFEYYLNVHNIEFMCSFCFKKYVLMSLIS